VKTDSSDIMRIGSVTIVPSEYWSEEFKSFYAAQLAHRAVQSELCVPARNASSSEWKRFIEANDALLDQPLELAHELYPVDMDDVKLAGVRVGIVTPKGGIAPENMHRVLINLHGGGFVYNHGLSFGQLESLPVASLGRIKVITIDYRQSPNYQYPAATEDVEAVYRQLLLEYDSDSIGIYGSSAGGDLTAQAVAWFQDKGLPPPGAIGICSYAPGVAPWPWGMKGDSRQWLWGYEQSSELLDADRAFMQPLYWYMQNADTRDTRAFPGSSDGVLAKFPPTLLLVGTREYWFSAATVAHAKFLKLSVESSLYVMEAAPHGAHVIAVGTPEARDANAYIGRWFNRNLR
jgi:epsilon-lactone hydrolase